MQILSVDAAVLNVRTHWSHSAGTARSTAAPAAIATAIPTRTATSHGILLQTKHTDSLPAEITDIILAHSMAKHKQVKHVKNTPIHK